MDTLSYKTISANKETAHKEWVVVDATDQVVGRLGSKVAKLLRGKYKPDFTPITATALSKSSMLTSTARRTVTLRPLGRWLVCRRNDQ